jgi:RHS repeat-associated protein
VTNLRLPGQYDERLLGSLGLQGPYYNWNRWYLPGVGRYLEPDPIALRGKMNGFWAPDWYGYANQNPLRFTDPSGLSVWLCKRVADLPLNPGLKHHWLVTGPGPLEPVCKPRRAGGMGKCNGGVPGHGGADSPGVTQTCMNDHSGEDIGGPGVTCELVEDIDEQCVNAEIQSCHSLGTWEPWNQCQTAAADIIEKCRKHTNTCCE